MFTSTSAFSAALVSVSIEESLGKIIDVNSVTDVELFPSKKGREALDFLESQTPDVILLDYLMPGLDGVHTLELIRQREQTADTPVIFLTGVTEKDKIQECMEYRPYGYLVKPAAREELISMINRALNEAQL